MATNITDSGEDPEKDEDMDQELQNHRRRKNSLENGENPISKQPRFDYSKFPPLDQAGRKTTDRQQQAAREPLDIETQVSDNENVILIQMNDDQITSNFNNPIKLTEAINQSIFHKYIIENSLRVLGIGKAIRFEVNDISKFQPLDAIKTLGNWKVNCKQPSSCINSGCKYGTIFPVDTDIDLQEIKKKIKTLWGQDSKITEIIRINKRNQDKNNEKKWIPSKSLRITFQGILPQKVIIGHTSYSVQQYIFPIPKCFKCLRYGHGILTCKNRTRCSKCSQYDHNFKECTNNPYCFFCDEQHIPAHLTCKVHIQAQEINKKNTTPNNYEVKKLLQQLNPVSQNKKVKPNTTTSNNIQTIQPQNTLGDTHDINKITNNNSQPTQQTIKPTYAQTLSQELSINPGQITPKNDKKKKENRKNKSDNYEDLISK
ncbi:uncharacterized protein LOC122252759 [Penaeus japonicus]|uniref:uncharacterized protein LOC122252759 n=1 Tax=Penaeus japonicus TaxID=27405 RepID=UPI001C714116|nr:uncharacterized protein LOC122252759 [Penaeus japonicus]